MIKYPKPLKSGDNIGITAPSMGVSGPFSDRLDHAIEGFKSLGYGCLETHSVRLESKLASNTARVRAEEFMEMYLDDKVNIIIPPWGGTLLLEILPFLDFEKLRQAKAKWVMGFSDTSVLLLPLLVKLDLATVHGPNALDFGAEPVHESVVNGLKILEKKTSCEFTQNQSDLHQIEWHSVSKDVCVPYNLTEKTEWKQINNPQNKALEGRLIGGCLDVISKLIGTPYADIKSFASRNADFGFIWYFESCEMNAAEISLTLTQMKMCGWFENCRGILFGRLEGYEPVSDYTFMDAFQTLLEDIDVPLIYDMDIGHLPPQITLINGAFASVSIENGRGKITQKLIP